MEASALQAPASLPHTGVAMAAPLLRFRSDEQLVDLFRAGHDEAFRVIHDRYHKRLFAYARQMLPGRQDAEDALQDVFVRAYAGLRASDQHLALRAWLFRVAHNRCIDELRRPAPPPPEVLQLVRTTVHDPLAEVDLRESLRRLIEDIRRLPEQQRSALLMRELAGMSYADLSASLGISVGAVKSLLVRARVALAQAAEARDTSCGLIREQLVDAHDRGIRPNANTRKHMRDCVGCKSFRRELRGMSRQLAAIGPAVGPLGVLAKALGFSGSGGGAAGGGGLALLGGGGVTASAGGVAVGINHVAALLAAAAATAGGAAEIQHTIVAAPVHHPAHARVAAKRHRPAADTLYLSSSETGIQAIAGAVEATASTAPKLAATADATAPAANKPTIRDPLGGGPVNAPPTGAASVPASPRTQTGAPSSGAAGLKDGTKSSSSSDACPVASTAGVSTASTTATTTATSTEGSGSSSGTGTAVAGAAASSTTTEIPCLTPTAASTGSTASTADGSSTSTASQTGGTTTSSSNTSSSTSTTSTSGSASSSSTQSTSSGGGSTSASK